jgi:type I restriction-modification system DNA methylase subunit
MTKDEIKVILNKLSQVIQEESTYSKEKSDKHGEVFTPPELINQMLNGLPRDVWEDKTKTWFDPCAGKGNFPILILKRLFIHLQEHITDHEERLKHIIENQLYMAEFQPHSAYVIDKIFSFKGKYKVNLYVGDTLKMPEDFFDLSYEERHEKYPENCVDWYF